MASRWSSHLPRPVAFVLSGGASLGALQVGMLRAIAEIGLAPDLIVGTSAGALNGAFLGQGFNLERVAQLEEIWAGLRTSDVFTGAGLQNLFRVFTGSRTLATSSGLRSLLRKYVPARHDELAVPTAVVAADLLRGEAVTLAAGNLHENVLASAAIPWVFPPVRAGARLLVDGGVVANVPILEAKNLGARSFVVLDAAYPCSLPDPPRNAIGGLLHVTLLMLRQQSIGIARAIAANHVVLYVPGPCPVAVAAHDFSHGVELIQAGYAAAQAFLADPPPEGPGLWGRPHAHEMDVDGQP